MGIDAIDEGFVFGAEGGKQFDLPIFSDFLDVGFGSGLRVGDNDGDFCLVVSLQMYELNDFAVRVPVDPKSIGKGTSKGTDESWCRER